MVSARLEGTILELADQPGMPDAQAIRNKMKRRMQNHRLDTAKAAREIGLSIDMVDALVAKLFPNTPGAESVRVEATGYAQDDLDEPGEDLLVRLYNNLIPTGHNTVKLIDASDPRLVDCAHASD